MLIANVSVSESVFHEVHKRSEGITCARPCVRGLLSWCPETNRSSFLFLRSAREQRRRYEPGLIIWRGGDRTDGSRVENRSGPVLTRRSSSSCDAETPSASPQIRSRRWSATVTCCVQLLSCTRSGSKSTRVKGQKLDGRRKKDAGLWCRSACVEASRS